MVDTVDNSNLLTQKGQKNWSYCFILNYILRTKTYQVSVLKYILINKDLFNSEHIIGLRDRNAPFHTGQNDVGLEKWRIGNSNEFSLPLTGTIYI
jgi:hypothetical protein